MNEWRCRGGHHCTCVGCFKTQSWNPLPNNRFIPSSRVSKARKFARCWEWAILGCLMGKWEVKISQAEASWEQVGEANHSTDRWKLRYGERQSGWRYRTLSGFFPWIESGRGIHPSILAPEKFHFHPPVLPCTHIHTNVYKEMTNGGRKKRKHIRKQIWAVEHLSSCTDSNVVHTKWQPSISYWCIHLTLARPGRWWDDKREKEKSLGMLCGQFLPNETTQAFQVLAVQFDVIVSGSLHPQRLHSFGAALVQGQPVGKIYHLILRPMDDQHWRCDFRHFLNAEEGTQKRTLHQRNYINPHTESKLK